jgi:hypothetical protein
MPRFQSWGCLRYCPTGVQSASQPASFYGRCGRKAAAQEVYDQWCQEYPNWIVMLVQPSEGADGRGRELQQEVGPPL